MNNLQSNFNKDQEFFSGLPFTKFRALDDSELDRINNCKNNQIFLIFITSAINPICIAAAFLLCSIFKENGQLPDSMAIVLPAMFIGILFIGIPVAILKIRDYCRRYKIFDSTIKQKHVRRFEGIFNDEDLNNTALSALINNKVPQSNKSNSMLIEALPTHDVLYGVNGVKVSKWIPLEITKAAMKNPDDPYYDLPDGLVNENKKQNFQRRKLTQGEMAELRFYAKRNKKRIWYLLLTAYCSLMSHHFFFFLGFNKKTSGLCAILLAVCIVLYGLYKILSTSRLLNKDAESGWAFLFIPDVSGERISEEETEKVPYETLMFSNLLWVIDGKPAGWRQKNKSFFGV